MIRTLLAYSIKQKLTGLSAYSIPSLLSVKSVSRCNQPKRDMSGLQERCLSLLVECGHNTARVHYPLPLNAWTNTAMHCGYKYNISNVPHSFPRLSDFNIFYQLLFYYLFIFPIDI